MRSRDRFDKVRLSTQTETFVRCSEVIIDVDFREEQAPPLPIQKGTFVRCGEVIIGVNSRVAEDVDPYKLLVVIGIVRSPTVISR